MLFGAAVVSLALVVTAATAGQILPAACTTAATTAQAASAVSAVGIEADKTSPPVVAPPVAEQLSKAFHDVARTVQPSVVSISTMRKVEGVRGRGPFIVPFGRSPLRDFFGDDFFDRFFPQPAPEEGFVQQGLGTGVIVSEEGYVLTNFHVIDGADEVTVQLDDERELDAEVVGGDAKTDLAVIKVDAGEIEGGLKPARLGDSDQLEVGQWVVAIGNPFGLRASITAGIVSAKGRSRVGLADYEDFIQTDAAINPGNSGGPLVNLRGEVVGINTAILSRSGGYMGIGLAIPINMARTIMDSLIEHGRVDRGWLGVSIQDLTEDLAASFGYDSTDGVLIGDVTDGSPAEKAGLKQGDIIVRFNGEPVKGVDELRIEVAATAPGTRVELQVFRDGKLQDVDVELGRLEDEEEVAAPEREIAGERLGMSVRTLTDDVAQRLGYEINPGGVVITAVEPFGPAARAGLRPRDVILRVQGVEIDSADDFRREIRRHDLDRGVRLTVLSGDVERFVILKSRR